MFTLSNAIPLSLSLSCVCENVWNRNGWEASHPVVQLFVCRWWWLLIFEQMTVQTSPYNRATKLPANSIFLMLNCCISFFFRCVLSLLFFFFCYCILYILIYFMAQSMPSVSNWIELRLEKNEMKKQQKKNPGCKKHLLSCLLFSVNFIYFIPLLKLKIKIEILINFSFFFFSFFLI